jgi:hypothetical protein
MGVGHLAIGFASKRWAPRTSLAWLMLAPIFVDMLWSLFVLVGIERARIVPGITRSVPLDLQYIPWSHSLIAVVLWGVLFGGVYFALRRDASASAVLFAGVFSHFVLDWISHRPDMPIGFDGPRVGLGLWNYPLLALATEAGLLAWGLWLYARTTRARSRGGRIGFAVLCVSLFGFNFAAYFGPPPPSITPMAAGNLGMLVLVAILYFVDRGRALISGEAQQPGSVAPLGNSEQSAPKT